MRIALIGSSSPLGYFYDHKEKYTYKEKYNWIPILEAPTGIVTLFDEVLFLYHSLCPISMKDLDFVKFLNHDSKYNELIDEKLGKLKNYNNKDKNIVPDDLITRNNKFISNFSEVVFSEGGMRPSSKTPIDNHSKYFKFNDHQMTGSAWDPKCLFFDLIISNELSNLLGENVELITNKFTSSVLDLRIKKKKLDVTDSIVISRIPVMQTPRGPILDKIKQVRENDYLIDFREKVIEEGEKLQEKEVEVIVDRIESEFEKYRNNVLLNYQNKARLINSIGRNSISLISSYIIPPGIQELANIINDSETREMNWTAFLAKLEKLNHSP